MSSAAAILCGLLLLCAPCTHIYAEAARIEALEILDAIEAMNLTEEDAAAFGLAGWSSDDALHLSFVGNGTVVGGSQLGGLPPAAREPNKSSSSESAVLPRHWQRFVTGRKKIGNGQFGDVARFQLQCPGKDTPHAYAMKVIRKSNDNDGALKNEISCLAEITDFLLDPTKAFAVFGEDMRPYITNLIAAPSVEDGYLFLASPLYNKEFKEVVNDKYTYGGREAMYGFMLQIAKGVALMHAAGWVHGDLKFENTMVSCVDNGDEASGVYEIGDCHASVIDLGIACRTDVGNCPGRGTPYYLAPEVLRRPPTGAFADPKTDVWSLGIMLFAVRFSIENIPTRRNLFIKGGPLFANVKEVYQNVLNLDFKTNLPDTVAKVLSSEPVLLNLLQGMLTQDIASRLDMQTVINQLTELAPPEMQGTQRFVTHAADVACLHIQCCYKLGLGNNKHYMTTPAVAKCEGGYETYHSFKSCGSCESCWNSCCRVRHSGMLGNPRKCDAKVIAKRTNECSMFQ